jgi:hypothetical protein
MRTTAIPISSAIESKLNIYVAMLDSKRLSQLTNSVYESRFMGNPQASFLSRSHDEKPLSRAQRSIPIF